MNQCSKLFSSVEQLYALPSIEIVKCWEAHVMWEWIFGKDALQDTSKVYKSNVSL